MAANVSATDAPASASPPSPAKPWVHAFGLLFVVAAAVLGSTAFDWWRNVAEWIGPTWTSESCRWWSVALLATTGVSFLSTRPIFFAVSAAMFALTAASCDALLAGKASRLVNEWVGTGRVSAALAVASVVFGYLVYTHPQTRAPSLQGIVSLLTVAIAGVGAAKGWLDWTTIAQRIGPAAVRLVSGWGQEVVWATAIVLTAVGVSLSRTRPVHLLNACLLAALAYHCVRAGYSLPRYFPELSTGPRILMIEDESYTNVEMWRWVVMVELGCLSALLLHMALGMGALATGFAVAWMCVGLSLYGSVGTMSLIRSGSEAGGGLNPLANMGVPTAAAPNATSAGNAVTLGAAAPARSVAAGHSARESAKAREAMLLAARHGVVSEATLLAWMAATAVFAGVIAVTGLRMISENWAYRYVMMFLSWLVFLIGTFVLVWVWPRDPHQSWQEWMLAFKMSRHHVYQFWLAFVGTMAISGIWALIVSPRVGTWVHAAIACTFFGTAVSLVGAAVLIRFGGFPPLPVWVYCVVAAGQSSLAWALLLHMNPPVRRMVQRRI